MSKRARKVDDEPRSAVHVFPPGDIRQRLKVDRIAFEHPDGRSLTYVADPLVPPGVLMEEQAWAGLVGAQELLPPAQPGFPLVVAGSNKETASLTLTDLHHGKPDPDALETPAGALIKMPASILAIGLGLLKDGRHVAFEAEVVGRTVKQWRPLCARPQVDGPERAWWQVGFATLCAKRELLPAERAANERDGAGVLQEHFAEGSAVAIVGAGRTLTGLAFHIEGATVQEPKVVGRGPREFCWSELAVWASLNMLPRRRKP